MNRKIIKYTILSICSIILILKMAQFTKAENFVKCDNYVNIHKDAYVQSPIVGYIYNNNIIQNIQQEKEGWLKITSGNVKGWINKKFVIKDDTTSRGYTVAKIHPNNLSVYIAPDKNSTIYTTVHRNQEIECIQYKEDWLTLAFEDEIYGFIDAYEAELKTYYGTAKTIQEIQGLSLEYQETTEVDKNQESFNEYQTEFYDDFYQINNYQDYEIEYNNTNFELNQQPLENYNNLQQQQYLLQDWETESQYLQQYEEQYYEEQSQYLQQYYGDEQQHLQQQQYYEDEQQYLQQQYYEDEQQYLQQYYEEEELILNSENNDIVDYADQFIGNPYVYGGNSLTNGIDCSHFVWQVLTNTGHYNGGYAVSDGWANLGEGVNSLDEAVTGDVIVYPGHVAIYDGNGGIVEAKGSQWGITHDRSADSGQILAIRHFD